MIDILDMLDVEEGMECHVKIPIDLLPKQLEILTSPATRKWFKGGRFAGKTVALVLWSIATGFKYPREATTVVSPTYKNFHDTVWPVWYEWASRLGVTKEVHKADLEVVLLNDHLVRFRSAENPEALRGPTNRAMAFDEAARMSPLVWQLSLPTLRSGGGKGEVFFSTTPKGKNNWLYKLFKRNEGNPDWCVVRSASRENYKVSKELLREVEEEYSIRWFREQELEGMDVDPAGSLFEREWFPVRGVSCMPKFVGEARAWDLATSKKTSADYTVGVRLGLTANGEIWVVDVVRGKWGWGQAKEEVVHTALLDGSEVTLGIEVVGMDTQFQEFMDEPRLSNCAIQKCERKIDKFNYALPFANRACAGKVFLVEGGWNEGYLDELCSFDGKDHSGEDGHDDQVDATTNALHCLPATLNAFDPKKWDMPVDILAGF